MQPRPKLRLAKVRMSTIGSRAVSTRQKNSTAETAQTIAKIRIDSSLNQSLREPSSSTYSSEPRKPAMKPRPHQSK